MSGRPVTGAATAAALAQEANALKAAGRPEEAIAPLRAILTVNPTSGVAEHNLAAALGDLGRWDDAAPHLAAAFRKGLDAPETWIIQARCMQHTGRLDEAEDAFLEAIRRRPDYHDAHRELAQLRWMRTGDVEHALTPLKRSRASQPANASLAIIEAQTLEFAGQPDAAFRLMSDLAAALPRAGPILVHAAQLAATLGHADASVRFARQAYDIAPNEPAVGITLCEALLAKGDAEAAARLAENLTHAAPDNQHAIAVLATSWRVLGDARYRSLYSYADLVAPATLDTPPGWPSLEAYLGDVSMALKALHSYREHPFNQSLRHGSQAVDILQQRHPALRALPDALDGPIKRHLASLGPGDDPVRRRNTGRYNFKGMWSVRLRSGGFHVDHVHPQGWLSSACYLETVAPRGQEGWIRFGQPGLRMTPQLPAEHFIEPRPGMLVLFPSYMWHGTVPFGPDANGAEQSRLTFAFDLVPA